MAEGVAKKLKALAQRGVLVVSSMHAPSSAIAQHFTHVLLLTPDGRAAYQGPYGQVNKYLSSIGRPVPPHLLPSDFMISLVSRRHDAAGAQSRTARLDELVGAFDSHCWREGLKPLDAETGWRAGLWALIKLNLWRSVIRLRRSGMPFVLSVGTFAVLGLLLGVFYYDQVGHNWRSMTGCLFLTVCIVMMVSGLPNALLTCVLWPRLLREQLTGVNSLTAALLGELFVQVPFSAGPVALATILYWMSGFTVSLPSYLVFVGVILLVNLSVSALSVLIGSLCPNPASCLAAFPAVLLPMVVFSGVLYQRSAVPWYFAWLFDVSIANFGFAALLGSQVNALPPEAARAVLLFCEVDRSEVGKSCMVLALMLLTCCALLSMGSALRIRLTKAYK